MTTNNNNVEEEYTSTDKELELIQDREDEEYQLIPIDQIDNRNIKELALLLPEDMRKEYKITKKAARKLALRLKGMVHGATVEIPMMCVGHRCPMANTCPLIEEDLAPIGKTCPIEKYLAENIRAYYIKDLQVDYNNFVQMTQINDLVECEILDQRMTAYLEKEGWFDDIVIGIRADGEPIFRKDEATSLKIKMRMKTRKDKLLRSFLATREMQAKYNLSQRKDPSNYAAELLAAGERLKNTMDVTDAQVEET